MKARAFWITGAGRGELRQEEVAPPGAADVLVRAVASGISRGTETLVFSGRVPRTQYGAMRAPFQEGNFPAPVKYGYSSVGIVEAGPASLRGRRVFALHPHQERYVVPADAVVPIPDGVSDRRAVLAANMETAVNALWDALPAIGDRVAVVGAGTVGCLAAALVARLPGVRIDLVDVNPDRAGVAAALGCRFATPDDASREADLVIHASGSAAGLATALGLAGFEATVLELSWYGDAAVPAPLGEDFHAKRLVLRSSQVGHVPPARRARWSRHQRLAFAIELLQDSVLDCLLTGESRFDDLPATMVQLAAEPRGALCHVVRYE